MDESFIWYFVLPAVLIIAVIALWIARRASSTQQLAAAKHRFNADRLKLFASFMEAARSSGKPRGLRWKDCLWSDQIEWVREKQTGQLLTLVGVTISFEAVEGGEMEGVEAVGNLRDASAVFTFDGEWKTVGRVIFNLQPADAVEHFKANYERCR